MKKLISLIICLLVTIVVTLGFISPDGVSLAAYLFVLVQIYALSASCLYLIITLFYGDMTGTKKRFVSIVLGFIPVGVLALGSLSRLTFLDVLLVVFVPSLIVWYAVKRGVIK